MGYHYAMYGTGTVLFKINPCPLRLAPLARPCPDLVLSLSLEQLNIIQRLSSTYQSFESSAIPLSNFGPLITLADTYASPEVDRSIVIFFKIARSAYLLFQ
jgi:hypothetical protein